MAESKLIMLEGLQGTGKSTTALYLALQYQSLGIPYRYYWELEEAHPLSVRTGFQKTPYALEERVELGLAKWRGFVDYAKERQAVTIFDGKPFHLTLWYMIRMNDISQQLLTDYIREVLHLIGPLLPKLIYLRHEDLDQALEKLQRDRGDGWVQQTIDQVESSPTGQRRNFAGRRGLIRFLEYYRGLLEETLRALQIDIVTIDTTRGDWHQYYRIIRSFLGLDSHPLGMQKEHIHLHSGDGAANPAELILDNRTGRTIIAYECSGRIEEYVFSLAPGQAETYTTSQGKRFRFHEANSGEIIQDVIACQTHQDVVIGQAE